MRCPACGSTDIRDDDFDRFRDYLGSDIRVVRRSASWGPHECRSCGAYYPRGIAVRQETCPQCDAYQRKLQVQEVSIKGLVAGRDREYERGVSAGRGMAQKAADDISVEVAQLRAQVAKLKGELETKQNELDKALGGKLSPSEDPGMGTRFSLLEVD